MNTVIDLVDAAIAGTAAVTHDDAANYTLTTANSATDEARQMILNVIGTLTAARNVVVPTSSKLYFVKNGTTGGFAFTVKTSAGTGISVPNGKTMVLRCDGTNVVEAVDYHASLTAAGATMQGHLVFTDATYDIGASGATRPRDGFFSRNMTIGGDFKLPAASKLYVDGGGNTYIHESSADNLVVVVGGTSLVTGTASTLSVAKPLTVVDSVTSQNSLRTYENPTPSQTNIGIYYNNGSTTAHNRVTVGAADSGGTGYRVLRVEN